MEIKIVEEGIGDKGATALSEALKCTPSLQKLDLVGTSGETRDERRKEGCSHSCLGLFSLAGNQIGDGGVQALSLSLKYSSSLQGLYLRCTQGGS